LKDDFGIQLNKDIDSNSFELLILGITHCRQDLGQDYLLCW